VILKGIEELTGRHLQSDSRIELLQGPDEEDLVRSGLEDTMVSAFQEILEISQKKATDFRTAAFLSAIDKVARSYMELGIFP
jgi:glutamate dehydrogenase (NAD(P)+)